jgi:hypothetical protein
MDLSRFLMRRDEEPGFRPGLAPGAFPRSPETITGAAAFAKDSPTPSADARRLRSEGFISFTVAPIRGPHKSAGVTNVALYETARGARHSMANDLRRDSKPHVANALWVQGRCYFTLGNQGPGPLAGRLSKGVQAIYSRTRGQCP